MIIIIIITIIITVIINSILLLNSKLYVWDATQSSSSEPMCRFEDHTAAVKAVAWSPHQHGLVASGTISIMLINLSIGPTSIKFCYRRAIAIVYMSSTALISVY
jgi:WD40 repeat protein